MIDTMNDSIAITAVSLPILTIGLELPIPTGVSNMHPGEEMEGQPKTKSRCEIDGETGPSIFFFKPLYGCCWNGIR